jgi:hypothetical protein
VIFLIERETSFELDFQKLFALNMLGNEVGSLEIIVEANRGVAVIGKSGRNLMVVVVLFLRRVELVVWD